MRTYARIESGAVAELLATSQDITHLFHPALHWVDVTGKTVEIGWLMSGEGGFAPRCRRNPSRRSRRSRSYRRSSAS